ncbi:MAG: 30S ribosomal protein S24e [Candidatus Bathyarchaeia archaeon]
MRQHIQLNIKTGYNMEITIVSEKKNPLLRRREVYFQIKHNQTGSTPPRSEVRKAVADALKTNIELVFIKKIGTKTGTQIATGFANVYDSLEQAKLIEPEYVVNRNVPQENKEGGKE